MRRPIASGFYPNDKEALLKTVNLLLSKAKKLKIENPEGAVVPHAGYSYSGLTAACAYASLHDTYGTVVLLGTNHAGQGAEIAVSFEDWQTPLGFVKNDSETGERICRLADVPCDEIAHAHEHSIEVQLPFLQVKLKKFKIVPIAVSSGLALQQYAKLASAIREVLSGKNSVVLASSDFTHYGKMYGFAPECADANVWVHETDKKIIEAIIARDAKKFIGLAENTTVCGAGAIATLMAFAKKEGKLADYRTSCDVSGEKNMIVGYGGILF